VATVTEPRCPVCLSDDIASLYAGDIQDSGQVPFNYMFSPGHTKIFPALRCHACTHVFCWPIPSDIARNYVDAVDPEYIRHSRPRQLTAERVFAMLMPYISQGHLLDVGCATGDYLVRARERGFEVEGVELSRSTSDIAKSAGLTVHREPLSDLVSHRTGFYDVISLIGVIHELENPAAEIDHVFQLLKPGGYLVLWTGNVDSWISKLLGRKWWYWQGQHVQYFTHRSLRYLATSRGFDYVATRVFPFAATYDNLCNSIKRYPFYRTLIPFLRILFALKPVWYLSIPGEMLFIARRPHANPA
jgi:2-polyprenyl-3-methyl-5-hydroxy-6-metoxy-1,4-benzoquinol methylase